MATSAQSPSAASRAEALLEAQVRFEVARLTVEARATAEGFAGDLLDALAGQQVADLVDRDALVSTLVQVIRTVPASALVGGLVELATDVAHTGPEEPFPLDELVHHAEVEVLLDELLGLTHLYERALERLTASPLVGTVAARFMGRIVGEVVATNQEIANKVPGLGSLVSFGTNAAARVQGAAGKQLEGLLGSSMDKGSAFAVRRLNRILIETMRDPVTREAALQAWDLVAREPVTGLDEYVSPDEAAGVVGAVHAMVVTALAHDQAAVLVEVLVDGFLDRFGGYSPTELLEQLDLERDDVIGRVGDLAPQALAALHESGDLERLVRARLAPFWESEGALALLAD